MASHRRLNNQALRSALLGPVAPAALLAACLLIPLRAEAVLPSSSPPPPPPSSAASPSAPPPADTTTDPSAPPSFFTTTPRPWLHAADPTGPLARHFIASLGVGYAQLDRGAARPFAADVAHAGAVFNAAVEGGVTRWFSVYGEGLLSGQGDGTPVAAGAFLGANFYPFAGRLPVDLAVSGGYLRELGGANGLWGRVAVAGNIGLARLSLSALGEKVFEQGRDEVDILLTSGASFGVASFLRLGAEYVVQDLEGAWDPEEADGGIRHFVGPNAILILGRGVQLAAGPAFGLSAGSPKLLGRLTATYAF